MVQNVDSKHFFIIAMVQNVKNADTIKNMVQNVDFEYVFLTLVQNVENVDFKHICQLNYGLEC